jgi:hypothetical protein
MPQFMTLLRKAVFMVYFVYFQLEIYYWGIGRFFWLLRNVLLPFDWNDGEAFYFVASHAELFGTSS